MKTDSSNKVVVFADTILVLACVMGILWWIPTDWTDWQRDVFGQTFFTSFGLFILLPMLVLWRTRRDLSDYGINFNQLNRSFEIGCTAMAVFGPMCGMTFPLILALGTTPFEWQGAFLSVGASLLALPAIGYIVRNIDGVDERPNRPFRIIGFIGLLCLIIAIAALIPQYSKIVGALKMLFFTGVGEELLFRGYVQSRLNQVFGRPYRFMGANFGWGLIIAAVLFGFMHFLSPSNPWSWEWMLWTTTWGFTFGYLREKSGSFVAPALVHGSVNAIGVLFGSFNV